ncbi:helix-turn-helix transcriptional regulator [Pseudovibrio axinellae]|nr:WYL domain-containing protein [Pseudovibrio axinellae]
MITALAKSGEPLTIGDIAMELGVSSRTASRDIEILRDRGLPIEADRGRGGGVRLQRNWGVGRLSLNYTEAVDLLISLAAAEQSGSPLFMAQLGGVRRKLVASFSPAMAFKINDIKSRIRIGKSAPAHLLSQYRAPAVEIVGTLHQAFLDRSAISITYTTVAGEESQRIIEPHYLLLSSPIWYVLAWDELRQDVRTFRCDRITSLVTAPDRTFRLRAIGDFQTSLEGIDNI